MRPAPKPTWLAIAAVGVLAAVGAAVGIGVRAADSAHVAVDEVQYLLTALSLAEDGDLDIADELAERRWAAFADVPPPVQTQALPGGSRVSPHDPLLPLLLALPMGLGGWVAAKLTLAVMTALLASMTLWTAVRRCGVPLQLATAGVAVATTSAPLAVYGQQVYPELPAALLVLVAVAALTGPVRRPQLALVAVAVTAAPWLAVKYVPVAAALAALAVVRWGRAGRRKDAIAFVGLLTVMGIVYLAVHRLVWGGWTVYATGDHFTETGEFSVVGAEPNYLGRSVRLVGLLVDRDFGLVAWQPAWLLVIPALGAAAAWTLRHRRREETAALVLPLAVGWLVATFVALTMHGFWWPGRQVVVVLPLAVLLVLRWAAASGTAARLLSFALGVLGVANYVALLVAGYQAQTTWVSQFVTVAAAPYRIYRELLPDYRGDFWALHAIWVGLIAALLVAGWRGAARGTVGGRSYGVRRD